MVKLPSSELGVKRGGTQHKQHPRRFGNVKRKGVRLGLGAAAGAINWVQLSTSLATRDYGKVKSRASWGCFQIHIKLPMFCMRCFAFRSSHGSACASYGREPERFQQAQGHSATPSCPKNLLAPASRISLLHLQ